MIALKYAALAIPAAIAGMAIVSSLTSPQSKAWVPYTNNVLSLDRLRTIDYFKISSERVAEGLLVKLAPQSTKAVHSQFGFPSSVSADGDKDIYLAFGQYDGIYPQQRIIFYYETSAATGWQPKATSALIPNGLLRQ